VYQFVVGNDPSPHLLQSKIRPKGKKLTFKGKKDLVKNAKVGKGAKACAKRSESAGIP
jgi:hypothetical protein